MISLLKQNWPTIRSIWGNFYLMVVISIAGFFTMILIPPLINGDFFSMAIGGFISIVLGSIWLTSVILWIGSLVDSK